MQPRFVPVSFLRLAFSVACFSLLPGAAPAQPAGTGTLEGRVLNAATGEYLEGARLTLAGTALETFSDSSGQYRFAGVPAGPVTLRVFYTGLSPLTEAVVVAPGATVQRDISYGSPPGPAAAPGDPIKLSEFIVGASREMSGAAIAINEQRFAANTRNVLSTDEFGFVAEGNAAEFLKYLPGVTIELAGGNSREVSLNGAPAANVPITLDGFSVASASVGNTNVSRTVAMDMVSVNNLSRIEVEYSPTPESQGAALAGSVNMVPRSAFERARPVFNGSMFVMMRSTEHDFDATPGPRRQPSRKVDPGFDFSYVAPINKRFGFTLSGGISTNFSPEPLSQTVWRGASAATNGNAFPHTSADQPYLTNYTYRDGTKVTTRGSTGATLDFKLSPYDRLSLGYQFSYFNLYATNQTIGFVINRVQPGAYSPTATRSAPGAAELQLTNLGRDRHNRTFMPTFVWRHDGRIWKGDLGLGVSMSRNHNRDVDKGLFNSATGFRRNVTIAFEDMLEIRPRTISVWDNATGVAIDPYSLDGKSFNTATALQTDTGDLQRTAYANLGRDFFGRVPLRLKGGLHVRQSERDNRNQTSVFTFLGADGVAGNADESAAPFLDEVYAARRGVFGLPPIQGISLYRTWDHYLANPAQYTLNANNEYRSTVTNSKFAQELISSAYLRGDVSFLQRRLKLVGGVRAEQTNIEAQGPLTDPTRNYQRDAQGRVLLSGGRPVPIFPAANALEVSRLTFIERGQHARKEYLRLFPSINASYNVRENLIARVAWYTSVGRPDFNQYAGGLTLPDTESAPSQANRIQVNNVGIKAWSARTTNVRLEYYFEGVGQISLNAFRRDFENFFGANRFPAAPEFLALYDLDDSVYGLYDVQTQYNVPGTVRMEGSSLNYRQALTFLPAWARGVQIFANGSTQRRTGALVGNSGFNFFPRSANAGLSLTRQRFSARAAWNYRGLRRGATVTGASVGADTYNWTPPRTAVDLQAEYYFHKRMAVFGNLRNATNVPEDIEIYGPTTPAQARFRQRIDYGSLWTFGVKGTF